jgi:hypothetical protein
MLEIRRKSQRPCNASKSTVSNGLITGTDPIPLDRRDAPVTKPALCHRSSRKNGHRRADRRIASPAALYPSSAWPREEIQRARNPNLGLHIMEFTRRALILFCASVVTSIVSEAGQGGDLVQHQRLALEPARSSFRILCLGLSIRVIRIHHASPSS